MQQTKKNGGLIMMHAENGLAIDVIAADTFEAGTTDPIGHGLARHAVLEGEATNRVIRLAQAADVPVYIVHLSAKEALEEVKRARDEGLPAFAETCPQYLFLSLDDLRNGFNGAKFVCSPPLRTADHHPELWTASSTTSSSSRPTIARSTSKARRTSARATSGRSRTACPASRTGWTCSTTRRRRREDHPRALGRDHATALQSCSGCTQEGRSRRGSDADLVVYDPNRKHTISAKTHHMDVDYSCYEGRIVQGNRTSSCRAAP